MAATDIEPLVTTPDSNITSVPVPAPSSPNPPVLGPGEVLKTSGKFPKPTKIPGKNYCKDEVVIRNSDSGKVEYMRPLILKSPVTWNARYLYPPQFFRPTYPALWTPRPAYLVNPGAKERLVQITGPSEDKIVHARHLMEDTIRRNASPVRETSEREHMGGSSSSLNSSASDESNRFGQPATRRSALLHSYSTNDATIGEYKYTVNLGFDSVKITGTNFETVQNAKIILEEYYPIWLQKNTIGDCYPYDEDVFMEPVQEMAMLRLNSVDSGDQDFGYPPIPVNLPEKRPVLGRSDPIPPIPAVTLQSQENNEVPMPRQYTREFLVGCATFRQSKLPPPNWDQVVAEYPMIARKVEEPYYSYENYFHPYAYNDSWTYVDPYAFPN